MAIEHLLADQNTYAYMIDHSLKCEPILLEMFSKAKKADSPHMNSSLEQIQLLCLLIKMQNAKKALEIGVFRGLATMAMAQCLAKDGQLIACDINQTYLEGFLPYWQQAGVEDTIDLRIAPALETLSNLVEKGQAKTFDFAYIDANKENYPQYYHAVYTLLRPGGLMVFDNVLWSGKVADPSINDPETNAIRALNTLIQNDQRVASSLVPIGDGIHIVRKD